MDDKLAKIAEPIEELLDRLGPEAVFGEPTTQEGVTIIPVSEVTVGFGFGTGKTDTADKRAEVDVAAESRTEGTGPGGGTGSGGGAGGRATPRGYIRVTPDGVKYRPITDDTRLAIAGMALAAWTVFWIGKTIRSIVGD